tara:strand:+ start:1749 stop:2243 length:495 start_codon:yes stop_codon:yes gene_type:complete
MDSLKKYIQLNEAKVSISKLAAGMKVNVIHSGRSARNYGIKDENVYGGKVQVLGIGMIPYKKSAKPNMVLAKDMKELKKKYEKVFKSEEILYGNFYNARHRLKAAFNEIAEADRRVKPGFGAYIWKVIEGENKGLVDYCYIGNDRDDSWEVRFLNKSTQFILET